MIALLVIALALTPFLAHLVLGAILTARDAAAAERWRR